MNTSEKIIFPNTPVSDGKTLKMLCLTSSFGIDTTELLCNIALEQGTEQVTIGRLYSSGCRLNNHWDKAMNPEEAYEVYYKSSTGIWERTENMPLMPAIKDEDWDIIYIQQGANPAALPETYEDYIDKIVTFLEEHKTNPNARYVWNLTWAYQSDSQQSVFVNNFNCDQMAMYQALLDTLKKKVLTKPYFSAVIPTGTAIQNARTSYFGDNLCKDTYHLNNLGKVIAGYTAWSVLTGQTVTEIKLPNPISTRDLRKPEVNLTEDDKKVILESVHNAIAHPLEITPSQYTVKPE